MECAIISELTLITEQGTYGILKMDQTMEMRLILLNRDLTVDGIRVQGIWLWKFEEDPIKTNKTVFDPENLLDFGGKSKYSSPELTWAYYNRNYGY